jgi:general secretion pathway protein D
MIAMAVVLAACAAGRAFTRGQEAAKAGDWETAVQFYRQALQDDPDRPDYKIALERAMISAAQMYTSRGREFEAAGQLEEALRAYRKTLEFEPSNRQVASKAAEIERTLRDRIEAATPRPEIDKLREQARQASAEPILNPTSREPISLNFSNSSVRDVLNFIGSATGINVTYDRDFQDRSITVKLDGVTLEQALQQIMIANQYFFKVLNERTIIVAQDTTQKRTQYEEQVIRTFFVSHSDANELATLLNGVIRVAGQAIQPTIVANKTSNTITIRGTSPLVSIAERIIEANDKPRAEVIVDVQILEVSRERAKNYGLNLTDYALGLVFSPEVAPGGSTGGTGSGGGAPTAPSNVGSPPPFNLNTISTGVSTADFYLAVPAAVIKFLESDSQTKVLAKPQLRGAEGTKLTLNLGEDVPVPSTTFTPIATGGAAANPLTSYGYRTIGIIVEMEPRVTYDGDVIMTISVENSARGQDTNIAGQNLPSFFSRKVITRLRLRDGESNLLAGLLREDERRSLRGFPGVLRLPVIKQLFSSNEEQIRQNDIVMLITPRIIRTHELRSTDLSPIYVGTQSNMSIGGPPPAIFSVGVEGPGGASGASGASGPSGSTGGTGAVGATGTTPITPVMPTGSQGAKPTLPPGSSPIPGTTTTPTTTQPPPSPVQVFPPPAEPTPPVTPPATAAPPAAPAQPPAAQPPAAPPPATPSPVPAPAASAARITLSPPGEMRVGGGPYTVPVSISGASRLSAVTISVTYNPALVRVRNVQEGTFMRQGGVQPTFVPNVNQAEGRVDIAIARPGDQTGASTQGLLAAFIVEPLAAGTGTFAVTGSGTLAGGGQASLQFAPAGITVR